MVVFSLQQNGRFSRRLICELLFSTLTFLKQEKVGSFRSTFYNINNLSLDSIKRREHLTEEDIQANKQLLKALKNHLDTKSSQHQRKLSAPAISSDRKSPTATKRAQRARTVEMVEGNGDFRNSKMEFHDLDPLPGEEDIADNDRHSTGSTSSDDSEPEENDGYESEEEVDEDELNRAMAKQISMANTRRQSLAPPPRPAYTWSEYINAPLDSPPCLGRPWKIKKSSKSFKPTLAMVSWGSFSNRSFIFPCCRVKISPCPSRRFCPYWKLLPPSSTLAS